MPVILLKKVLVAHSVFIFLFNTPAVLLVHIFLQNTESEKTMFLHKNA